MYFARKYGLEKWKCYIFINRTFMTFPTTAEKNVARVVATILLAKYYLSPSSTFFPHDRELEREAHFSFLSHFFLSLNPGKKEIYNSYEEWQRENWGKGNWQAKMLQFCFFPLVPGPRDNCVSCNSEMWTRSTFRMEAWRRATSTGGSSGRPGSNFPPKWRRKKAGNPVLPKGKWIEWAPYTFGPPSPLSSHL